MLAEASGFDPSSIDSSPLPERSRPLLIHDRRVNRIPRLEDLSSTMRKEAIRSPAWWRFAVVRDPYARFFSAWAEKVLLRAPGTRNLWSVSEDIVEGGCLNLSATFRAFVKSVSGEPEKIMSDWHFTPQRKLVYAELFDDLEIFPLSRIGKIEEALSAKFGLPLRMGKSNESLPLDYRQFYDSSSIKFVRTFYGCDIGCDPEVQPPAPSSAQDMILSRLETDLVFKVRSASERISDLSRLTVFPRVLAALRRWTFVRSRQ